MSGKSNEQTVSSVSQVTQTSLLGMVLETTRVTSSEENFTELYVTKIRSTTLQMHKDSRLLFGSQSRPLRSERRA